MTKVKLFFIATVLLLITAGVFAGNHKFMTYSLYGENGEELCQLTNPATLVGLSTTGTVTAQVTSSFGKKVPLRTYNGSIFIDLYTTGTCF